MLLPRGLGLHGKDRKRHGSVSQGAFSLADVNEKFSRSASGNHARDLVQLLLC
jgi:hypothetical protein